MNKLNISTVFVLAIGFFFGCHSNNQSAPQDGAASNDSAMTHDLALIDAALPHDATMPGSGASVDSAIPHDLASIDASLSFDVLPDSRPAFDSAATHDLALADAALSLDTLPDGRIAFDSALPHDLASADTALSLDAALPDSGAYFATDSGDSVQRDAGDGPDAPAKPVIKPVPGRYAVRLDPAFTRPDSGVDPITPLDKIGLGVSVDATTGLAMMNFFPDANISGIFPITDGSFDYTHGYGLDGTVCPADGYAIDGTFVSPTEFRGSFTSIYYCSIQNSGKYIATLVVADAGIDAYVINPTPGDYSMKPDPAAIDGGADQITQLNLSGFTVSIEAATGLFWIVYVPYAWRCDEMKVVNGAFDFEHGQGFDGNGGTNCPTDGYAISGSFVSSTEAHGKYVTLSSCRIQSSGTFVATLASDHDAGE